MARWIGIDFGEVRTGLAFTDKSACIAFPHKTVATAELMVALDELVHSESCAGFALGLPSALTQIGEQNTDSTSGIIHLKASLQKKWPKLPVHLIDESFSSREARMSMVQGGMKKKKREVKGAMDRVAAAIILQRFLETRH